MANLTLDHIKTIVQSVLASATRYKPNLSVTDPDDPRYVVGAEGMANKVAKAQSTANTAKTTADAAKSLASQADGNALDALDMASTAQSTASTAQSTASTAQSTANNAGVKADILMEFGAYDTTLEFKIESDDAANNGTTCIFEGDYTYLAEFDAYVKIDRTEAKMEKLKQDAYTMYQYKQSGLAYYLWITNADNVTIAQEAVVKKQGITVNVSKSVRFRLGKTKIASDSVIPSTIQRVGAPMTLTSPSGTKYTLSVDDDGNLTTTEVTDS